MPVQSAYCSGNSTETALVGVLNILSDILSVDRDHCIALALLNLSAAFETVDHKMLLDRFPTSSDSVMGLWTALRVALVYVLTSTRTTPNSQSNSRLIVNRMQIASSVGGTKDWMTRNRLKLNEDKVD